MDRKLAVWGLLLLGGCSSSNNSGGGGAEDAAADSESADSNVGARETGSADAPMDTGLSEGGAVDTGTSDASDGGAPDSETPDGSGGDGEAGAPACPTSWTEAPTVPTVIALPDGGIVLLHAAGAGTQDYACVGTPSDAGVDAGDNYAWTLTGPTATLSDCNATVIGHHFASEGGAAYPEWQLTDGTYVVGNKVAPYTPDGGGESVPWLLLRVVDAGGTGALSGATYVQRLDTDGGVAPSTGCSMSTAGTTTTVPYTADYYFYGP